MDQDRFKQQFLFLTEVDKMKSVMRQTYLINMTRTESDAEHSWHMALMAMILEEYAHSPDVNMFRVLKMALIHDLIEIYAGDTPAFDDEGNEDKVQRELIAADKVFQLLPKDQAEEYRLLWEEFDAMETPDSIYASAIDRLQPLINNYCTGGSSWKHFVVTNEKIYKRFAAVRKGVPELWDFVEEMLVSLRKTGFIQS